MALFRRLIQRSEWSRLAHFVSPRVFELVPARELTHRARLLLGNWWDRDGYQRTVEATASRLLEHNLGPRVRPVDRKHLGIVPFVARDHGAHPPPPRSGEAALELFFSQLRGNGGMLLDLRRERFSRGEGGELSFTPLPLWLTWPKDFLEAVRDVYEGFYHDDEVKAARALGYLGLTAAKEPLWRGFGGNNKTATRFSVTSFEETFEEVFELCHKAEAHLHPELVTLGILLLTLTDHLEGEGGTFNVMQLHERVRQKALPPEDSEP